MTVYYHIDGDRITIRPLAFLAPIGIALVLLLLLLPVTTILILSNGHLQAIEPKYFAWYIMVLPLVLACIPLFTYSRRQIVFDTAQQCIYLKTVFRQKELMAFNRVHSIQWITRLGIAYYLRSKDDKYGKGYRISPSFAGERDKDKLKFDETVLPAIWNLLETKTAPANTPAARTGKALFDAGQFNYYQPHQYGYLLKPMKVTRYLPVLIGFGLFAIYSWYGLLTKPVLTDSDKQLSVLLLIPLLACLLTITKKVVFDNGGQKIKLYRLGLVTATYPINTLAGFNIVRKTYNGLYNGTDVRLKFDKPGSKQQRELTLADFGKTNSIEEFINETEYIIERVKKG